MTLSETAEPSIHRIYYQVERHHWWFLGRKEILLSMIQNHFPQLKDKTVLDIGASTGSYVEAFQELGAQVEAHDASLQAISYLRRVSRNGNIQKKKFPDDYQTTSLLKYDLVLLLDVLEHIRDDKQAFHAAFDLVKPGGLLILTVPACMWLWGPYDVCNRHYRRYHLKQVQKLVNHEEVAVKKLSYFSTLLFPLMLMIRALENVFYKLTGKILSFYFMPGLINKILLSIFRQELWFLRRFNLPFGSSILVILEKK